MPVVKCETEGSPGFKWGDSGKCYIYTPGNRSSEIAAIKSAEKQGAAARAAGWQETGMDADDEAMRYREDHGMCGEMLKGIEGLLKAWTSRDPDTIAGMYYYDLVGLYKTFKAKHDRPRHDEPDDEDDVLYSKKYEAVDSPTPEQRKNLPRAAYAPADFVDSDGKFISSKSKLPHHINTVKDPDDNATVDVPRLRNALARFDQVDWTGLKSGTESKSKAHLEAHADAILKTRRGSDEELSLLAVDLLDFQSGRFKAIRARLLVESVSLSRRA